MTKNHIDSEGISSRIFKNNLTAQYSIRSLFRNVVALEVYVNLNTSFVVEFHIPQTYIGSVPLEVEFCINEIYQNPLSKELVSCINDTEVPLIKSYKVVRGVASRYGSNVSELLKGIDEKMPMLENILMAALRSRIEINTRKESIKSNLERLEKEYCVLKLKKQ